MLEISHVSKKYDKVMANKDVTFTVPDQAIALLVGPNGAGKSTIIKCIMGLLRYEGEIKIDGILNKSQEGRGRIGYVPEIPNLYPLLTVAEHLEFVARVYKLKNWEPYAQELLDRFEMSDKRDKLGSELSKGMQQKVSIMTAMLPRPRFILFDEPMVGLDPHAIKQLKLTFEELKAAGTSLLISTHILDTVDELWDQVCIMMDGRIVAIAQHEQLSAHGETLEDLFFRVTEPYGEAKAAVQLHSTPADDEGVGGAGAADSADSAGASPGAEGEA